MINLLSIVALGFFLRHATDPDHVTAVSMIVNLQHDIARLALIGVFWGVGPTPTILVVGAAIVRLNLVIPPRTGLSMELLLGLMLIVLGLINIRRSFRSMPVPTGTPSAIALHSSHPHIHSDRVHSHPHSHSSEDHPQRSDQAPFGYHDRHFGRLARYQYLRPLIVGIVHGLAGSAAVALFVLATIHTRIGP